MAASFPGAARWLGVLPPLPMRVVSLVPSLTETLVDLGVEVVGATRFCVHPRALRRAVRTVGGTKTVDVEAVRALRPDLVVANREENLRAHVEAIADVADVHLTDIATVDAALEAIRALGARVGRARAADDAADAIARAFAGLDADVAALGPPVPAACFVWKDPWMSVGGDTFASDVLARGGLASVFADARRYPETPPDDVAARRPDVLVFPSEPFRFRAVHTAPMAEACPGAAVRFVDGEALTWYGTRMRHAPAVLRALRASLA